MADKPTAPLGEPDLDAFPWFPVYVGELLALAATLDAEQLGGLLRLRAFSWTQTPRCTLPDDDARLAVISGLGAAWTVKGAALRELFTATENGRLLDEAHLAKFLEQVEKWKLSMTRRLAGQVGGRHSAAARDNAPPRRSSPRTNARSNAPTKTGDVVRSVLDSVVGSTAVGTDQRSEALEATAEATADDAWDRFREAKNSLRPGSKVPHSSSSESHEELDPTPPAPGSANGHKAD